MPRYEAFSVNRPEEMEPYRFDDPDDSRRFFQAGDDQINCVGDALLRNLPAWSDRVDDYVEDFPVFGSVCEPFEYLWRIIGSENALVWMAETPGLLQDFINRLGGFLLKLAEAQIQAGHGRISGMYIWGDVAYVKGMLFGARRWRELFKPHVKNLIDLCHSNDLMVVYHGCGNAHDIFEDFVDIGLDCYNPLEAKSGLDVVELKKEYTGRLTFCGNVDIRVLEAGDQEAIEGEVLYKLRAAEGGGWIFQSDHSISSLVSPESYETALRVLRENGEYPLGCTTAPNLPRPSFPT